MFLLERTSVLNSYHSTSVAASFLTTMPILTDLRCEHYANSIGISHSAPRLSRRFEATGSENSWTQQAYTIKIHQDGTETEATRVETPQSVLIPWPGSALRSRERVQVEISVEGLDGERTSWADLQIEAG